MPNGPISPPPVRVGGRFELPAYLSNGLVGLRIPDVPLLGGYALVNGFTGEHQEKMIEAAALAPFPLGGNLSINGVSLSDATYCVGDIEQAYDFASGELTTRFSFSAAGARADVEVLTFCSRDEPSLVCQQVEIAVHQACNLIISSGILTGVGGETAGVGGRPRRLHKELPGKSGPVDGAVRWGGPGDMSTCGLAYMTRFDAEGDAQRSLDANSGALDTAYKVQAEPGRRYRLTQMTAVVPGVLHRQPEMQAARLVAMNYERGFPEARARNRAEWDELWKSRIVLVGADPRWQAMADAAFFYINSSVHSSSHASTSIFGLATWKNYHYYYGHVMWDIETFIVPVLSLVQPHAAAALLEYRYRSRRAAGNNACIRGLRGLQFPWESAPSTGDEAAPLPGTAAWHEDHVSLDIALAFALHARITGDRDFMRRRAWPIILGVATWLESRVSTTSRGYEIHETTGIAEREKPADNAAFINMSAQRVLSAATEIGAALGETVRPIWIDIAERLVVPKRDDAIVSYDAYRDDDEKGGTPDPLMGLFPLGCRLSPATERATLDLYLPKAKDYLGSPMLSAFYGVWAAWSGDRVLASDLLDEGYAAFIHGRFMQTLEYRHDRFPEQPIAGPFFANSGAFLMALFFGFPALIPDTSEPREWSRRSVTLPAEWEAIEVQRVWIHGKSTRLTARQGADAVVLEVGTD